MTRHTNGHHHQPSFSSSSSNGQPHHHHSSSSVNPFAGQNIGYLRLAVVGDSGVGKTSFARQFTETLPEVLSHDWEPLSPTHSEDDDYKRTDTLIEKVSSTMMEIPWDNMDADDEVPARNLVFVDTPGYGSVVDAQANFDMFMAYIGQTFDEKNKRISPFTEVSNNELMRSLVTGVGAHKFIDVCFYLIVHRLKPIDVEYMRLISEKANVVPVVCKVDTQSEQDVRDLKVNVLRTLKEQGVSIYTFRIDYDRLIHMAENGQVGGPPFAVSNTSVKPVSADANDHIAFKPAANELPLLRKLVLETQITNIRQFTVKKFINWRGKHLAQQQQQHQQQQQQSSQQQPYYQQHQYQQAAR
ncbi:MAG: Septin-type guanine nucleotide-binding (G) domain-containing protein [Linnemannia gamsii]|nr:MAG: Septin-type guanine nucleotide-binding (G) domain-containing protein [Linnemannia gamsii]